MTAAVILSSDMVDGAVLSLASNVAPDVHLPACRQSLADIGRVTLSAVNQNACQFADNHAPKQHAAVQIAPYHNQIAVVMLNHAMPYAKLWQLSKQLERDNGRQACTKPNVTLDVDILAVRLAAEQISLPPIVLPAAAREAAIQRGDWQLLARRLPLASYDRAGLASLPAPWAQTLQAWFDAATA